MKGELVKRCKCSPATASGPRVIVRKTPVKAGYRIWAEKVELACDVCDTAWEWVDD